MGMFVTQFLLQFQWSLIGIFLYDRAGARIII